jgi:hypothetical protein
MHFLLDKITKIWYNTGTSCGKGDFYAFAKEYACSAASSGEIQRQARTEKA